MRPVTEARASASPGKTMTPETGGLTSGKRNLIMTRTTSTTTTTMAGSLAPVRVSGRIRSPDQEIPFEDQRAGGAPERDVQTRGVMSAAVDTTVSGETGTAPV